MTKKGREDSVIFQVWDKTSKQWLYSSYKARCWEYEGRMYKLFRIGVLAACLGRTVDAVQKWHKDGRLPPHVFSVQGGSYRYYSEDQIRMTSFMQRTILGNNPDKLRGKGLNMAGFFEAVRENWGVVDFDPKDYEVVEEETGVNDVRFDV